MDFKSILARFNVKELRGDVAKAICKGHPDKEASLSIKYDRAEGKTILYCHAGCETRDILSNVGLKISDLFDRPLDKTSGDINIEAIYNYKNENGDILFSKIRFKPKKFAQKRIIDGATVWGLEGGTYYETFAGGNNWSKKKRDNAAIKEFPPCKPILYNLPELMKAIKQDQEVFIVEGEKDVDNINKLGLVATCNFDGASKSTQKTKWREEYNENFRNAKVILIPDNDDPGRSHMDNIAKNLNGIAESIKIINLTEVPEKGDFSDWLDLGHTEEELQDLIHKTELWTKENISEDLDTTQVEFNSKYVIESGSKITIMPVMENIISILKHYSYEVKYNEIVRKVFVFEKGNLINELGEDTIFKIKDKCIIHKLNIPPQQLKPQLYRIGIQNTYNPIKDYLLECREKWDKKSRLEQLYETLHCDELSEKYKAKYIRKMFVTAVNLILSKDVANSEGVLTLAGGQGIGKTSWFRNLIPKKFIEDQRQLYFLGGKELELNKKDSLMEATSTWFMEIGEVSSAFKKNEIDDLKNFITRSSDRFRVPYGSGSKDYKRFTVFVSTCNDSEFLVDSTGSRRWWVLHCNSINYKHNIDMDAIWGEAVYLWETGKETNYFTLEEQKEMQEYNTRFETLDTTTILIMSCFDFKNQIRYWMKADDVFEILNRPNDFNTKKLGIALKKLKLDTKIKDGYKYYSMPPAKNNYTDMKRYERANFVDMKEIDSVSKLEEITMFKNIESGCS